MSPIFQGTDEEWQELEAPFLDVDPKLNIYALANGLDLLKNHSGSPDRTLEWYREGMERRASIVAEGGSPPRFSVWAAASRKQDGTPLSARRAVSATVDLEGIREGLTELIEKAMEQADRISREELGPLDSPAG